MKENSQNRLVLLLFIISSVAVIALSVFTSINLNTISRNTYADTEERLLALSENAANLVTAAELNEFQTPTDMQKPLYAEIKRRLMKYAEDKNVIYVYYMRNTSDGMAQYIIDNVPAIGPKIHPNDPSLALISDDLNSEPFEWEGAAWAALHGTPGAEMEEYFEGFEHLISAFAPIYDNNGNVVAVVGVDIDDSRILAIRNTMNLLIPLLVGGVLLSVICCFAIVLLHRRMDLLRLRNADLLALVNGAAVRLLTIESDDFETALSESMGKMAQGLNVDCAYIWRLSEQDDTPVYVLLHSWLSATQDTAATFEGKFLTNIAPRLPDWDDRMFGKHGYLSEVTSSFSDPIRSKLLANGVKAIMAFPVSFQGRYWGFVSFENRHNEKLCSEQEASILQSGSLLLANAVERNDTILQLNERLEQQQLTSSIARSLITKESLSDVIRSALASIGTFFDVERLLIAVFEKNSEVSRPEYFWIKDPKYQPETMQTGFSSLLGKPFPHYQRDAKECLKTGDELGIYCDNVLSYEGGKYKLLYEKAGVYSFICTPIYVEGELWGALSIEGHDRFRKWNESDRQLISMVSSTISNAVARDIMEQGRAEATEQAIRASRAKGDFLSNMSHEMRTPMNAIIGMTAIGKAAADTERKDYSFDKIEEASKHLLGVINDILDMSKIEAGKFDLTIEEFSFERMLQRVANIVNYKIAEKQQRFKIYVDRDIPEYLMGDGQRLTQVITNLVGNAVKFTPEKGVIRIGTYFEGETDGTVLIRITVTDTGIGISPEQQARLFKSFQQAESSTSRKYGGTGLGLTISKSIIEMMNGEIWIESELGKGSTFGFTVQVKRAAIDERKLIGYGLDWGNVRILVVDNDMDTMAFFKKITREFRANCDTVLCGEDALELAHQNEIYDIYFIGQELPDMDGLALVRALKEIETVRDKATVAMFSETSVFSLIESDAKEAGVDAFVTKPLFPSNIIDTTNEVLGLSNDLMDTTKIEAAAS
ncbi:MAG: ATP-binding protein, partial [Coriobacteriia bacterium]|nr:ATP-binding protein [Coriobacteriia bacterium]